MSGLEELRRLEAAATKGPWTTQDYDHNPGDQGVPIIGGGEIGSQSGHLTAYTMTLYNEEQSVADAEFIVAARNQLPRILDALDAVQALADTLEVRAAANHARATAAATHHWQDSGAYQALELGQTQAAHEIRAAITKALEGKQ